MVVGDWRSAHFRCLLNRDSWLDKDSVVGRLL